VAEMMVRSVVAVGQAVSLPEPDSRCQRRARCGAQWTPVDAIVL